eukprot:PLAT4429.2.p1 GENE.PLAT4429.2~~PLAT4429.2.p1  ORF type:complete len:472 (-),score=163.15 PLAT4429.2:104-1519(-)
MDFLSALGLGGGGGGGGSSGSSFSGASFSGGSFSGSSGDVLPGELTRLDDRDDLIARLQRARPPERAVMNIAARAIQRQWMEHKHGIVRPRTPRASEPKWHEIAPEDITMLQKIGEGAYGIVYKGLWRGMLVAVKEIKVWAAEEMAEVEHEAALMSRVCNHDHVVNFVGVSTTAERLSIVTKFMSRMSCDDVLVKPGPGNMRATLSMAQLLRMAMDTAAGIMHLHREGVIHRDLACRNLLVDDHFRVRVADFGFSRTKEVTASKGYTHSAVGPIKWMAPEALRYRQYSEMTDSFSFGVCLYEIATGRLPWEGLENMDVVVRVCNGERMDIPADTNDVLASIMRACWSADPHARPPMATIFKQLHNYYNALRKPRVSPFTALKELPPASLPRPTMTVDDSAGSLGLDSAASLPEEEPLPIAESDNLCPLCHKRERNCLVQPCMHIACCMQCGKLADNCPQCGAAIKGRRQLL